MAEKTPQVYRYTECGLDNVYIHGLPSFDDDAGEPVFTIPNVNSLHRLIAEAIVSQDSALAGRQLRFLRTEMGLTQAELGRIVHKEMLTVGRWERGENQIDDNADTIIRLLVIDYLGLETDMSVEDISGLSTPTAGISKIDIDGEDPQNYVTLPAAV